MRKKYFYNMVLAFFLILFIFPLSKIAQATEDGYLFVGYSNSFTNGSEDFLVFQLDSNGKKKWRKNYGGLNEDISSSACITTDGGFAVSGYSNSFTNGSYDFLLFKTDSTGKKQWRKNFGGIGIDKSNSIIQTNDGGYLIGGISNSFSNGGYDFLIYKLNENGEKQWKKNYGGTNDDYCYSVIQTSDGGYLLLGTSNSFTNGGYDFVIYKINQNGKKQWRKNYGGIDNEDLGIEGLSMGGRYILQTSDGGYIFIGSSRSFSNGESDIIIFKLNSSGNKMWRKNYGGIYRDSGFSIKETSDGGYIFVGATRSFTNGLSDFILFKINSYGKKQWRKNLGGTGYDYGFSIQQTSDNGYMVAGTGDSFTNGGPDFLVYKLNSNGSKQWRKNFGGINEDLGHTILKNRIPAPPVPPTPPVPSGAIIIDHTCTNLLTIPDYWIEQAKLLTFHYGHTSHGSQINTGLFALENFNSAYGIKYSFARRSSSSSAGLPSIESPPALREYDGNPPETYIQPNDYWQGESALNRTRAVVGTGDYNVSGFAWCGQMTYESDAFVNQYLIAMNQLEAEYPSIKFIYMTGHLDGSGASGDLHRHNEMIREYCRNNNKILFDFADIERYNPDGVDFLNLGATDGCYYNNGNWADQWIAANPNSELALLADSGNCDSCAHSRRLNCILKGRAFWWLVARLAGWDGN